MAYNIKAYIGILKYGTPYFICIYDDQNVRVEVGYGEMRRPFTFFSVQISLCTPT